MTLQCWEYGISLCRELAFQYETLYDYQSLSWIRVSPACSSFLLLLQTSIFCDEEGGSVDSFLRYCHALLFGVMRAQRQTQCPNYLCTPTLPRKWSQLSNVCDCSIIHLDSFAFCSFGDRKWRQHTMTTSLNSRGLNRSSFEWASMAGSFLSSSG